MLTMARPADTVPAFELHRFAVAAAGAETVLLELEVRWPEGVPAAGRSRLLAGDDDEQVRIAPAAETVHVRTWRATFAVPVACAAGPLAIVAGGYVVDLPEPDPPGPEAERVARLAREGNALRRRLDVAEEEAAHAESLTQERDGLRSELDEARAELARVRDHAERERERLERRVTELQADLAGAAQEREAERAAMVARHESELAAAGEQHGAALAALAERHAAELAALEQEVETERAAAQAELEQRVDADREELEAQLAHAHAEHRVELEALEARLGESGPAAAGQDAPDGQPRSRPAHAAAGRAPPPAPRAQRDELRAERGGPAARRRPPAPAPRRARPTR